MRTWKYEKAEVREYPPGYRTVFIEDEISFQRYALYLPYTVLIKVERPLLTGIKPEGVFLGLRNDPLPNDNILNEELMFPPFPNVYRGTCHSSQGLVCCSSDFDAVWTEGFCSANHTWVGDELMEDCFRSYENWEKMPSTEVLQIFRDWPKCINHYSIIPINLRTTIAHCITGK